MYVAVAYPSFGRKGYQIRFGGQQTNHQAIYYAPVHLTCGLMQALKSYALLKSLETLREVQQYMSWTEDEVSLAQWTTLCLQVHKSACASYITHFKLLLRDGRQVDVSATARVFGSMHNAPGEAGKGLQYSMCEPRLQFASHSCLSA